MSAFSVQKFKTEASMATVRGSRFVTVLAVALGGFIVLASGTSFAQEKHKISWSANPRTRKPPFRNGLEFQYLFGHTFVWLKSRVTCRTGGGPAAEGESA